MSADDLLRGPDGALVGDLRAAWGGISHGYACQRLRRMVAAGEAFEARRCGNVALRYFATAAARDAWLAVAGKTPATAIQKTAMALVSDGRPYLLSGDVCVATGACVSVASTALVRMVGYGLIASRQVGRRHFYFASDAAAAAFSPEILQAKARALNLARSAPVFKPVADYEAGNAPVKLSGAGKGRLQGDPIITSKTRITRDTTVYPTARWQMRQEAPDERWPSFSAARPGIDPATGQAWAAQAR